MSPVTLTNLVFSETSFMRDNKLVKSAGEHWVCSVLSGLGWAAALTRDGIARTDLLATNPETGLMIAVQVKAASLTRRVTFPLGAKGCDPSRADNEWFVFVVLGEQPWKQQKAYVVPRDHVAAATWIRHQEWRTNPEASPGTRNTGINGARVDEWVFARYAQRWDLLNEPTGGVPVMLPPRFRKWAMVERVGLPSGHPWQHALPEWDLSEVSPTWPDWAVKETGGSSAVEA